MNQRNIMATRLACVLAGDVVRTFGEVRLRVFGTSMVPSILPGDLISVQRAGISEISAGEIVLALRSEQLLVHRVVSCDGGAERSFLITRGDRLRRNDPPVSAEQLLGRVISVERSGRKIDFAPRREMWMRPLTFLLQTSQSATSAYLRVFKLLAARAEEATPLRPTEISDGQPSVQRATPCRL